MNGLENVRICRLCHLNGYTLVCNEIGVTIFQIANCDTPIILQYQRTQFMFYSSLTLRYNSDVNTAGLFVFVYKINRFFFARSEKSCSDRRWSEFVVKQKSIKCQFYPKNASRHMLKVKQFPGAVTKHLAIGRSRLLCCLKCNNFHPVEGDRERKNPYTEKRYIVPATRMFVVLLAFVC